MSTKKSRIDFGRELIVALKLAAGMDGPPIVIPVGSPPIALLRPVATRQAFLNKTDVKVLTEWRNKFVSSFLTEFVATEAQTMKWLTDFIGPKDTKILFMVDDLTGRTFGYMGFDFINWEEGYGEADAIVKGGSAPPGTMKLALTSLLEWGAGKLGLRNIYVRVRSDNSAIDFYKKTGFSEVSRIPLCRIEEPSMVKWVEDNTATTPKVSLVYLKWKSKST